MGLMPDGGSEAQWRREDEALADPALRARVERGNRRVDEAVRVADGPGAPDRSRGVLTAFAVGALVVLCVVAMV